MSIDSYVQMLADQSRVELMQRALRQVVRDGDVVADLGTGTGAFALFAAHAGAGRVIALELESVEALAREMIRANGASEVVSVVRADAELYSPEESFDVVIFEDFEDFGLGPIPPRLTSRWRRFLKPGGRFVPESLTVHAAPIESEPIHRATFPWAEGRGYGLDLRPLAGLAGHHRGNHPVKEEDLLATSRAFFRYELGSSLDSVGESSQRFLVRRAGTLHGLAVWFDADLAPGIAWSNAPGRPETVWRQAFLPTPEAVSLDEGEAIEVTLRHAPWGRSEWLWGWEVQIYSEIGELRHRESRSTFHSFPTSVSALRRRSLDHLLRPGLRAEVLRFVLDRFDGTRSARQIGIELYARFPTRFSSEDDAAREALDLLEPLARFDLG